MQMTAEEIVRHYQQAANKTKDVGVLAELNATDTASIKAILIDAGVMAPEGKTRRKKMLAPASQPGRKSGRSRPGQEWPPLSTLCRQMRRMASSCWLLTCARR